MKRLFGKERRLYLVTDTAASGLSHLQTVHIAISSGIKIIQLREKYLSKKDIYQEAFSIRTLALRCGVTFIINDHIDIAIAVDADGVHLGQEDMPIEEARKIMGKRKIIGISTHSLNQALDAEASGADYIGYGPIFNTFTKDAGKPKGITSLTKISEHVKIPIAAIGGITHDNVREVLSCGADAVAVASAILSGNVRDNIKRFKAVMDHQQ